MLEPERSLSGGEARAVDFQALADDAGDNANPAATRGERGPTETSGASNIAGSSSPGARFASTNARGKRAAMSGAPRSGTLSNSSSTKASSERRKLIASSRELCAKLEG